MEQKVVSLTEMIKAQKLDIAIQEKIAKKSKTYAGDFKRFQQYTEQAGVNVSFED